MPENPGQMLLHYRLLEQIGEGGTERLARFEREAKLLASLNHPHIATVHGLHETTDGAHFLAMELVAGEDLTQRLARGAIPADQALRIAHQVAGALEAAHENGIVHRDLKPANIRILPRGDVKVLDFGLAKELSATAATGVADDDATRTSAPTQAGMVLGTAGYMSPEQVRGQPIDTRADIWAFG